jgi:hypothetical protein
VRNVITRKLTIIGMKNSRTLKLKKMNYIHRIKKVKASASDTEKGKYFIHSEGVYVPDWLIEMSEDWDMDYYVGARVYDPQSQRIYTKGSDGYWKWKYMNYADNLVAKNIRTSEWYILEGDEKVWVTMEGGQIPFSKVTQQHWSNIYHYHLDIGASRQVHLANEMLAKNKWDLLPQKRLY